MTELRRWSEFSESERAEAVAKARHIIAEARGGMWHWHTVAKQCGCKSGDGIRRALDPTWREACAAKKREAKGDPGVVAARHNMHAEARSGKVDHDTFAARLAEIPPDTRNLTGVVFGDPLPGRSALARRHA